MCTVLYCTILRFLNLSKYIFHIASCLNFLFFILLFVGSLLSQKASDHIKSHKTRSRIERAFPLYNKELRERAIASAVKKLNDEENRRKEVTYQNSFLGQSNRLIRNFIPDFNINRFFGASNNADVGTVSGSGNSSGSASGVSGGGSNSGNQDLSNNGDISPTSRGKTAKLSCTVTDAVEYNGSQEGESQKGARKIIERKEKEVEKEVVKEEEEMCPICLSVLENCPARLLPCGHAIHTKCLIALVEKSVSDGIERDLRRGITRTRPRQGTIMMYCIEDKCIYICINISRLLLSSSLSPSLSLSVPLFYLPFTFTLYSHPTHTHHYRATAQSQIHPRRRSTFLPPSTQHSR